ncbi:MAG TPA: DUF4097 domain-containing protein [Epulopiscium sp.]|nr:DUF4097 domain-containing protein [Candidatus Epulonipiscium sp.]
MKNAPLIEGEVKSFSGVEKIVVDAISLPIHIYESDVATVTVTDNSQAYGLSTSKPNMLSQKGHVLSFKQGKPLSFLSIATGNIIIEVPRGSTLEYDINNISGSLIHDAISKNTLTATSISGSIRIHQAGEKVFAKSTSGSVRIYSSFEDVEAKSVSGSVRILANQDSKQILGSSISGSVRIQLENVSGYTMDYSTTSASVKDTYANTAYSKSGKTAYGDSSLKINASSVSGSIKLTDW